MTNKPLPLGDLLSASVLSAGLLVGSSACKKSAEESYYETTSFDAIAKLEESEQNNVHQDNQPEVTQAVLSKPIVKKPFKIDSFDPGQHAVEIERKVNSKNAKTVVYILDYHINGRSISDFQHEIQGQIHSTVKGIIDEYGSVPISIENWIEGQNANSYLGKTDTGHTLYPLFNENDENSRAEMVPTMIERFKLAGPVIVGAYPNDTIPLGSVTESDIREVNEIVDMDNNITDLRMSGRTYCTGKDGHEYDLAEAKSGFISGGNPDAEVCYCAVHKYEDSLLSRFRMRLSKIPVKEVQSATSFDHNFSVVIAGYKHFPVAKKELDRQDNNYVVVVPKTLAPSIQQRLDEDIFKEFYPDNEKGTCKTVVRTNRTAISRVLKGIM